MLSFPRILTLLTLAGGLAGCGAAPPDTSVFFRDMSACAARFGGAQCADAFETATREHVGQAPVSLLREECERWFGRNNCEGREMPSKRSYYVPAMMGFLTDGHAFSAPVYSERDGRALVLRGRNVYRVGQFVLPPPVIVRTEEGRKGRTEAPSPQNFTEFRQIPAVRISGDGFIWR